MANPVTWPPTPPNSGYIASGYTTIIWGTEGAQQGDVAGYIVKSVRVSERIEEAKVENGAGLTATEIVLRDGFDYEITVVDDSSLKAPPQAGQIVFLMNPISGNQTATTQFEVINNSYNLARKQEGERVLLCRAFTLFPTFSTTSPIGNAL